MTAEEAAEADARNTEGSANGLKAREFVTQRNPAALGGIYIDHLNTGKLTAAVTTSPEFFEQALEVVVPYPRRLAVRVVPYSLQQLDTLHAQILSDVSALRKSGVRVTGIVTNESDNAVDLGVERLSPEDEKLLRARYPAPFLRLRPESPVSLQGYAGLDSPPFRGGQGIWANNTNWVPPTPTISRCTSGFVSTAGPGQYYLLTAGHCLDNGVTWWCTNPSHLFWNQGWPNYGSVHYPIGSADRCHTYPYAGTSASGGSLLAKADAARIPINPVNKSDEVTLDRYRVGIMNYAQTVSGDVVGERVCVSGAASGGEHCGTLIARNRTVNTTGGYWFTEQREASYFADMGDSGGPVLDGGIAKGLHVGVIENGNKVYSHVGNVLSVLGLVDICGAVRTQC